MIGAIIDDIAGSRFEFDNTFDYQFDLFSPKCDYTDDTICTVAIADALLQGKSFSSSLVKWCQQYPRPLGGYGSLYRQWVFSDQHTSYGSWGNGAAMRVSPVAWYYSSLQQVLTAARETALPTHDHPEGIKGAQAVAHVIYALHTRDKSSEDWAPLLTKIATHYYPDFKSRIFTRGYFDGSCMGDVPLAFRLVLTSSDFEDAIRRAISWGGDSDTIGAIVGSVAEAIWQISAEMEQKALTYLPTPIKQVIKDFDKRLQALQVQRG